MMEIVETKVKRSSDMAMEIVSVLSTCFEEDSSRAVGHYLMKA